MLIPTCPSSRACREASERADCDRPAGSPSPRFGIGVRNSDRRAAGDAFACNSRKFAGSPRLHMHPNLYCVGKLVTSLPSFIFLQFRKSAVGIDLPSSSPRSRPAYSSRS